MADMFIGNQRITVQGPKGDTGDTGPKGDKGDTGDTGADSNVPGPQGPSGTSIREVYLTIAHNDPVPAIPTISFTNGVINLPSGWSTTSPTTFDFDAHDYYKSVYTYNPATQDIEGSPSGVIKRDADSITGPVGPQGPKGDKGDKGDTGDTGPAGADGNDGGRGPAGPIGPKGDQGDPGDTGPKGDQGDRGPDGLIGPDGQKGDKGDKGDPGEGLPDINSGDAGKVAVVKADETGWEIGEVQASGGGGGETGPVNPELELIGTSNVDVTRGDRFVATGITGWADDEIIWVEINDTTSSTREGNIKGGMIAVRVSQLLSVATSSAGQSSSISPPNGNFIVLGFGNQFDISLGRTSSNELLYLAFTTGVDAFPLNVYRMKVEGAQGLPGLNGTTGDIPGYNSANAGQSLQVNPAGDNIQWADIGSGPLEIELIGSASSVTYTSPDHFISTGITGWADDDVIFFDFTTQAQPNGLIMLNVSNLLEVDATRPGSGGFWTTDNSVRMPSVGGTDIFIGRTSDNQLLYYNTNRSSASDFNVYRVKAPRGADGLSGTTGTIPGYNAANAGQALKVNDAGNDLEWGAGGGGGFSLTQFGSDWTRNAASTSFNQFYATGITLSNYDWTSDSVIYLKGYSNRLTGISSKNRNTPMALILVSDLLALTTASSGTGLTDANALWVTNSNTNRQSDVYIGRTSSNEILLAGDDDNFRWLTFKMFQTNGPQS